MISEVTIDADTLIMSAVDCAERMFDGEDRQVPAVVPVSDEEDGSDSDEGCSCMTVDEDGEDSSEEDVPNFVCPNKVAKKSLYHELYLPRDSTAFTQAIVFSGGMDAAECEEYYRSLEETASSVSQRDEAEVVDSEGRKRTPIFCYARRNSKKTKGSDDDSVSTASCHSVSSFVSSVSFNESVTVHPIHAIEVLPDDVWESIYTPRREVKLQKKRAKLEFRYDGRDWRSATEEDGMFIDPSTGLLEHPVHYYHYENDSWRRNPVSNGEMLRVCLGVSERRW